MAKPRHLQELRKSVSCCGSFHLLLRKVEKRKIKTRKEDVQVRPAWCINVSARTILHDTLTNHIGCLVPLSMYAEFGGGNSCGRQGAR